MTIVYVNGIETPKEELCKFEIKSEDIKRIFASKLNGGFRNENYNRDLQIYEESRISGSAL